jgi:hypothetical protein
MSDLPIVLLGIASVVNTIAIAFLVYKVYWGSRHE